MELRTLSLPNSEALAQSTVQGLPVNLTSEAEALMKKMMAQSAGAAETKQPNPDATLIGLDDSELQQSMFTLDQQYNQRIAADLFQTGQGYQASFGLNVNNLFGFSGDK